MSHLFAIGVDPIEIKDTPLVDILTEKGFLQADAISHEYAVEAYDYLKSSDTKMEWYFALEDRGNPDLDIVYELPKEIDGGRLESILDIIINHRHISTIGIFMYDLGTKLSQTYDDLRLDEIKNTLKSWYEFGGPDRTVYHLFKRK